MGTPGVWTAAAALGVAWMMGIPASAAGQAKAGVVTTLQGTATVARSTAAQPAPLKFRDDVFIQDHIVTGESSIVRILLGGKAVVTVRERSALTIHETPTTSTIELGSGKMALAVARERMKPGESVRIKTPNAMAGVRGTVVIADVAAPAEAGGAVTTHFTLLTGLVDVARLDTATGQATGSLVTLSPLQTITVTGGMPPGAVRAISGTEAQSLAADYKVVLPPPPPPANTQVTEQQVEIAVQHSAALTGAQPGSGDGPPAAVEWTASGGDDPTRTLAVGGGATAAGSAGGGAGAAASVTVGGGTLGASATATIGGGGIGAGANVGVGSTVGAGGSLAAGGGGLSVGAGVGVGGIGAGAGLTAGSGGVGAGVGVTVPGVGGVTIGGGGGTGSGSGGGGGLLGGIIPTILPLR